VLDRVRRSVASMLVFAIILTIVPVPSAADGITRVQAIDPLTVADAPVSSRISPVIMHAQPLPPGSFIQQSGIHPVAFVPFAVVDPSTGKPVARSATIYLPHQHRYVNAGKYYDDVNRLEASLNKQGYTLRSNAAPTKCEDVHVRCATAVLYPRLRGGTQPELTPTVRYQAALPMHPYLQPHVITQLARLDAMVNPALVHAPATMNYELPAYIKNIVVGMPTPTPNPRLIAAYPQLCVRCQSVIQPSAPPTPSCVSSSWFDSAWYPSYWYWASKTKGGIKDRAERLPPLCHMPKADSLKGGLTNAVSPWSASWGDASSAKFALNTNLKVGGDAGGSGIEVQASAKASAWLLGNGMTIASANATTKGDYGSIDLEVLGQTIWNPSGHGKFSDNQSFSESFFNFQIPIPILWFQITLEASAQGSFGVQYGMNLSSQNAGFFVEPYIAVSGTFSANFGIGIVVVSVSVGIYGTLTIAQFGLQFSANGSLGTSPGWTGTERKVQNVYACALYFQYQLSLDDNFTVLSGQMGVQAQACLDLFFWSHCWTAQVPLFNWNGITSNDNLFSIPATPSWTQVGPLYTDEPEYGYPLPKGWVYSPDDKSGEPAVCDQLGYR